MKKLGVYEQEERAVAAWEAKMDAEETELREACNRVSFKAIAHLEDGYGVAKEILLRAMANLENGDVGLSSGEKHIAYLEFARSFNRMLDVSSRIVVTAIARAKRSEGPDERSGWMDLVEEIRKGKQGRLPAPRETIVVVPGAGLTPLAATKKAG